MRQDNHSRRTSCSCWLVGEAFALFAVACGAPHPVDGDGDVADADADRDADSPVVEDADGDEADAEESETDADVDDEEWVDTTWLAKSPEITDEISAAQGLPGGDLLIGGRFGLARLDPVGHVVWAKSYESAEPVERHLEALRVTAVGRIYVGMQQTNGAEVRPNWIAELDGDGAVLRQRGVDNGLWPVRIAPLSDGTLVVAGEVRALAYEVMRYSPEDGVLWRRRLSRPVEQNGYVQLAVSSDSTTVVVLGFTYESGSVVVALDPDGEPIWVGSIDLDDAAPAATADGGLVLVGHSPVRFVRLDADGTVAWAVSVGWWSLQSPPCMPYCENDYSQAVAVGPNGELLAAGFSTGIDDPVHYNDMIAMLVDPDGTPAWQTAIRARDRTDASAATVVAAVPDGRWVVAGHTYGATVEYPIAVLGPEGALSRPCSAVVPVSRDSETLSIALEPVDDLTIEEGTLELLDMNLVPEDIDFALERICP